MILSGIVLIGRGAGSQRPLVFIVGYWMIALSCFMALMFRRSAAAALVLFFIAMSVGPLIRIQSTLASTHPSPQIEEIQYIMENTTPTETVMDGYRGSGVFRPHAYFFWFLALNERSGV